MRFTTNQLYLLGAAVLATVAIVLAGQAGAFARLSKNDSYKAVFLTNNQVFFGRTAGSGGDYLNLKDVYYLRNQSSLLDPAQAGSDLSLQKLGRELHAPKDTIRIAKDQILYIQDLSDTSRVLAAIRQASSN